MNQVTVSDGRGLSIQSWFTSTGLNLPDDITDEDFESVGYALALYEGGIQWCIGDFWNNPKNRKYGGGMDVAEKFGLNYSTASDYAKVSNRYEISERSLNLSWSHHQAVAYDDNRIELLKWAEENNASVAELKRHRKTRPVESLVEDTEQPQIDGIFNCDCIEGMRSIPGNSIDLVATDPPYNMDKADWDSYGSGEEFAEWAEQWLVECQRVLKPHGSIYIFGINRMLSHLQRWLEQNMVYRNWIIWDTIQGAGGGLWTNRYESILYYSKTNETYEDTESVKLERHEKHIREYKGKEYKFKNPSNIWRFPVVDARHKDRSGHITQKPVEVMQRIIRASCPPGGVVLDPFMGSGTTAVASEIEGRRYTGFEKDAANYQILLKRLNNVAV